MNVGTNLTLEYKQPGKELERYSCKIIDRTDEELIIDYPIHTTTKKTVFFSVGSTFSASYTSNDNAVIQFRTEIIRKVKLNIPGIAITLPEMEEMKRIQRREFVRIDATLDVAVHSRNRTFEPFTTMTTDISGGGLSLITSDNSPFNLGDVLDLWLVLYNKTGKYQYVYSAAKIVFIQTRDKIHTLSVKFVSIDPKEQQRIIGYCFDKQREARKKELS